MSDDAPTPPAPRIPPGTIGWRRARLYFWSLLLVLSFWLCGTVYSIRYHPEFFMGKILAQLPFPASVGKVYWVNRRTLELDQIKLDDFFDADALVVTASPIGLWRHHLAKLQVIGGQVFTKALYAAMDKMPAGDSEGIDWVIGRLELSRGTLMLDNLIDTAIPVRIGVRYPVILNALRLGKPDGSADMIRERVAEVGQVNIVSPFDPLAPVLAFPLTRVRFTYEEIWHHRIRGVTVIRPTIYLGEDLFWFSGELQKSSAAPPTQGPSSPWQIGHFELQYGQLAVNAFGQPVARLPFFFESQVDEIRLDQLDKISAKSSVAIHRLDKDYPDYKIGIKGLSGQLYFSLPYTDANANNVVNTIKVDELSWNQIPVKKVVTTVTFDPQGVFGKLTGECEKGELTGNFEFYYTKGFTWNADFFVNKVNVQPIVKKLGGSNADLTGMLDGKLEVKGRVTEILDCHGSLSLPNPGVLEIKSMKDLLNHLPADASALKKQAMTLAIQSFQTYPYQNGDLKIDYKPSGGSAILTLKSPAGGRHFDAYWHPYGEIATDEPAKPKTGH